MAQGCGYDMTGETMGNDTTSGNVDGYGETMVEDLEFEKNDISILSGKPPFAITVAGDLID